MNGRVDAVDRFAKTAGSASTDAAGHFVMALPAGEYRLHVEVGGAFPRCPEPTVTVPVGRTVVADISCDTGMR